VFGKEVSKESGPTTRGKRPGIEKEKITGFMGSQFKLATISDGTSGEEGQTSREKAEREKKKR